jgi:iron(II)-dependent oxidoreductase
MVYVSGGEYPVGGDEKTNPPKRVELKPYYISSSEVTRAQFKEFVDAGGYRTERFWDPEGWRLVPNFRDREDSLGPADWVGGKYPRGSKELPVTNVSWYEADAFARFKKARLPSEYEWEVAASYYPKESRNRRYPWGDFFRPDRGNLRKGESSGLASASLANGDRSPLGLVNMAGNASEWTSSLWGTKKRLYVIRGCSASHENPRLAALTYRRHYRGDPGRFRSGELGFRLAMDVR